MTPQQQRKLVAQARAYLRWVREHEKRDGTPLVDVMGLCELVVEMAEEERQ